MDVSHVRATELLRVANEAMMRYLCDSAGPIKVGEEYVLPLSFQGRTFTISESEIDHWEDIVQAQRELHMLPER